VNSKTEYVHVQDSFSIKDLENLTGIKAHTIRIWEKRYQILVPTRTDGNYRVYDLDSLKKLLNVSYLNKKGIKISTISKMNREEVCSEVERLVEKGDEFKRVFDELKICMYNFDEAEFNRIYYSLEEDYSFEHIYKKVFIPFLTELGFLWQAESICPAHEHFIFFLIRQKMLVAINKLPLNSNQGELHTLFLPENEVHETGLIYLHYHLRKRGKHCVYLGPSVGMSHLHRVIKGQPNKKHHFYSILTTKPSIEEIEAFVHNIKTEFDPKQCTFHLSGRIITQASLESDNMVKVFDLSSTI
jgi:DNA-binding transcriptional MerR regulator